MMDLLRVGYGLAIAMIAIGTGCATAAPGPVGPAPLLAALSAAPGSDTWRTEKLSDGRIAAIASDAKDGPMRVIGIACGASKRPEIAAVVRGGASFPRALLADSEGRISAFPIEAGGPVASGVDALVSELALDEKLKLWLDQQEFPATGLRAALAEVEKDCAQRFRWEYGNDDSKQLVWTYDAGGDEPGLVFGKPATDWIEAVVSCNRAAKSVSVSAVGLPRKTRNGQSFKLALQSGDWKLTANARAEIVKDSDSPGFAVAKLDQPGPLLDALASRKALTLKVGPKPYTVPGRGADALLPRFRAACGL